MDKRKQGWRQRDHLENDCSVPGKRRQRPELEQWWRGWREGNSYERCWDIINKRCHERGCGSLTRWPRFFDTLPIDKWSLFPPLKSSWACGCFDQQSMTEVTLCKFWGLVIKAKPLHLVLWNTCSWSCEPPCKKENYPEMGMLKKTQLVFPMDSPS